MATILDFGMILAKKKKKKKKKNRFSRWQPSWISDRNDFSYFWSTSHSNASYQAWNKL